MGSLFGPDDGYPDHQPIPSPLPEINLQTVGMPLALTGAVYGICPAFELHDHPPHHDRAPAPAPVQAWIALGSTSAPPFFSSTDASDQVIRRLQMERRRVSHTASMPMGTNPALFLQNDLSSSRTT